MDCPRFVTKACCAYSCILLLPVTKPLLQELLGQEWMRVCEMLLHTLALMHTLALLYTLARLHTLALLHTLAPGYQTFVAGVARAGMDASMRDALVEVEKDRSQLSGVIVSRFDSSLYFALSQFSKN